MQRAYEIITTNKNNEDYIGILLKYSPNENKRLNKVFNDQKKSTIGSDKISVGLIGAGNFAKNTLLPIMKDTGLYHFKGLATTGG